MYFLLPENEIITPKLESYCVKSFRILSYSGPYFLVFGINTDQNNFKRGPFLCSDTT